MFCTTHHQSLHLQNIISDNEYSRYCSRNLKLLYCNKCHIGGTITTYSHPMRPFGARNNSAAIPVTTACRAAYTGLHGNAHCQTAPQLLRQCQTNGRAARDRDHARANLPFPSRHPIRLRLRSLTRADVRSQMRVSAPLHNAQTTNETESRKLPSAAGIRVHFSQLPQLSTDGPTVHKTATEPEARYSIKSQARKK